MARIHTRLRVDPDHRISGVAPPDVPPGEHQATIIVRLRERPRKKLNIKDLPSHDLGPWPEALSLRREDIYDEDGR